MLAARQLRAAQGPVSTRLIRRLSLPGASGPGAAHRPLRFLKIPPDRGGPSAGRESLIHGRDQGLMPHPPWSTGLQIPTRGNPWKNPRPRGRPGRVSALLGANSPNSWKRSGSRASSPRENRAADPDHCGYEDFDSVRRIRMAAPAGSMKRRNAGQHLRQIRRRHAEKHHGLGNIVFGSANRGTRCSKAKADDSTGRGMVQCAFGL